MPRSIDYIRVDLWRFSVPRRGTKKRKTKKTKRRQRFAWLTCPIETTIYYQNKDVVFRYI